MTPPFTPRPSQQNIIRYTGGRLGISAKKFIYSVFKKSSLLISLETKMFLIIFILMMVSSCASPSSETPLPSTPTSALNPTSTPPPTITQIVSPTSALAPQDFYGIWSVWDAEAAGMNYLIFTENDTYFASHGPNYPAKFLHQGTYTLDGNMLTFFDWWDCESTQQVGTYIIKMYPDKQSIRFFPLDDLCKERAYDFTTRIVRWNKFVPTQTPLP